MAIYPTRAEMLHENSIVTVGNGISLTHNAVHDYGVFAFQNTSANGDTFTHSFLLAAGTYTLSALGVTDNYIGKIDWYIDDVKVVSLQDWYSENLTLNVRKAVGGISVSGNGRHVLKGVVNGKTGSDYFILLTRMSLIPASDVGSV